MSNPFYDKKTPQFTERVLFERSEYDEAYRKKLENMSKLSGYHKLLPSELLESLPQTINTVIKNEDIYKGNRIYTNPIAKEMDDSMTNSYNIKKQIYIKQIPYIYKY